MKEPDDTPQRRGPWRFTRTTAKERGELTRSIANKRWRASKICQKTSEDRTDAGEVAEVPTDGQVVHVP